ncbi:MAG TPA: hypothetical protein VJ142_02810 [Candidatus Nanoarchaeia archaeon]|nr:hypothetical protein [Candidatus Nanoarchaeia archaeon]
MGKSGIGLEQLKKEYEKLQRKYNLPSFKEMNEDFHIEKIAENDTELLPVEIRRWMWEKFSNYMRLLEGILNPVNVPMFIFSIIKTLNPEEKKNISEVYKKLMKEEIKIIRLDLDFNESKEAEFIKESYKIWQEIKKELSQIFSEVEKRGGTKTEENSRGYFG